MKRHFSILFLILPAIAWGFLVLRLNLEQLTQFASRIVVGRCLEVVEEKDAEGRSVDRITLEVRQTLKGTPEKRLIFRQIKMLASTQGTEVTKTTVLSDLPTYQVGEEMVLFLSEGESGLSAPVGLLQGKFLIEKNQSGKKMVLNGTDNRGLFLGLAEEGKLKSLKLSTGEQKLMTTSTEAAPLPYADFVTLVKKLSR